MKKAFCALAVSCLGIGMTVAAFSGCASEEELFAKATDNFNNYTAEIHIAYSNGRDDYNVVLMVDGAKGKLDILQDEGGADTRYFKEDQGSVFSYLAEDKEWIKSNSGSTIEEVTAEYNGYVFVFQNIFYDDFEKQDDYLVAGESVLNSFSEQFGMDIASARVKLDGDKFVSATIVLEYFTDVRMQVNYTFKNYGGTKVDLPE